METIAHKLEKVINSKMEIKESIESYGVEVGDAPLNEYPQKIDTIEELHPDINWIMEAKVGNHPVVTAADIAKIKDYIAEDNGATGLLAYADGVTSIDFRDVDEVGAWALGQFARNITTLVSATFPALTTVNKERALYYTFGNDIALTSVSFPNLTTVNAQYALYQIVSGCTSLRTLDLGALKTVSGQYVIRDICNGITSLQNLDLSSLVSVTGTEAARYAFKGCTGLTGRLDLGNFKTIGSGNYSCQYMFQNCTHITEVDLHSLTTVNTTYTAQGMFNGCTDLQYVDMSSFTTLNGTRYACMPGIFSNCPNLKSIKIHPLGIRWNDVVSNVAGSNPLQSATYIENIELTANATQNLHLDWQPNLTAASVKNVLEHCNNTNMNGKSVTFKAGLTVTDDAEGSLQALKDAVIAQGCTINNLTINPYMP